MHQGIGRETFNEMPETKAVHALYECCASVTWARKVAEARPFTDHNELFQCADKELFALSEESVDEVLIAYPPLNDCPGSGKSHTERHAIRDELAKINRARLERMLGPEGGFQNWW
jgi:2-oxo-4-hydroxy-4-carboxy-5-ureidoimidazoline decarboxylase